MYTLERKVRKIYVYVQFHVNARCEKKNAKLYFCSLFSLNFLSHWVRTHQVLWKLCSLLSHRHSLIHSSHRLSLNLAEFPVENMIKL